MAILRLHKDSNRLNGYQSGIHNLHLLDLAIAQLMADFPDNTRFLLGFSGGMDSTVLLHALIQKLPLHRLQAIYINHGLQSESEDWAKHCAKVCEKYGVAFQSIAIQIPSTARQGVESIARQKRYQTLCEQADPQTVLLTAHHQRDQAETFLLNLARGGGIAGLAAMPMLKKTSWVVGSSVCHYRPLLNVPYAVLGDYAQQYQLDWIEDQSNTDQRFRRNYIRHEILPKFNQAWPFFEANVAQSAHHLGEGLGLLDELAAIDLQSCSHNAFAIQVPSALLSNFARVKNLIRYWVSLFDLKIQLNQSILDWIEKMFEVENPQSQPQRYLAKGCLRIYHSTLFFYENFLETYQVRLQDFSPSGLQFWNAALMADLKHLDTIVLGQTIHLRSLSSLEANWLDKPKNLKRWFKQHQVPVWDRKRWPVVEVDGNPVGVLGYDSLKTFRGKQLPKS